MRLSYRVIASDPNLLKGIEPQRIQDATKAADTALAPFPEIIPMSG